MKIRQWLVPALVLGASVGLFAFGGGPGPGGKHDGPPPPGCPRDSAKRMTPKPLTDEQKTFLRTERAMRDSMDQAVHAYAESVRKGIDPRSMVTDRAIINDFARRLERLREDNMDTWLDLLAVHPMHMGKGPRNAHGMKPPPQAEDDSLPPPPPEGDSARELP